jgi:carbon-monoxide dehydrogenase large subunit
VQGFGQVVGESIIYRDGQPLTASFMDYAMPRADELCDFLVKSNPVPTATNPLGVKGAGEAGTVGAVVVLINAVVDALRPLGVRHIEMPASPERVWAAIHAAPQQIARV